MYGTRRRFWLVAIIVAFAVIFFGVILFRLITKTTNTTKQPVIQSQTEQKITEMSQGNTFVRMSIDGQINSEEQHRQIRISVSKSERTIDVFSGYNYQVLSTKTYANTSAAYDSFLNALQRAGYTKKRKNQSDNFAGVCPLGTRTIFETYSDDKRISQLWTSSCSTTNGTFAGNVNTTTTLFKNQIPDYSTITQNVHL